MQISKIKNQNLSLQQAQGKFCILIRQTYGGLIFEFPALLNSP
jgi:hypothetical protein